MGRGRSDGGGGGGFKLSTKTMQMSAIREAPDVNDFQFTEFVSKTFRENPKVPNHRRHVFVSMFFLLAARISSCERRYLTQPDCIYIYNIYVFGVVVLPIDFCQKRPATQLTQHVETQCYTAHDRRTTAYRHG